MRWLGLARRAHGIALDWAATRKAFGGLLGDLGMVQQLVADSEIDMAAAGRSSGTPLPCWTAAPRRDRILDRQDVRRRGGQPGGRPSVQICGASGVSGDLLLGSYLRELRPFRVYDGPSETHRWSIARRALRRRGVESVR